ncbi:VOC family protein [Modestobacter sp. I12A-02628]|uniref:VOC family protein n=1 Tax=Goekera deserti TaxID=2497753 RepID=A0A7K3WKS7_9ACTN|nr:VOC family protein [Goekera deserti]MPQ99280.1 VOC family protein [Goekera deserti]NDI50279.1 VOC family protein [Goekera deserti]NEL56469.1 VOC family protein [Goekera deserti]
MPARFKDLCLDAIDHQSLADWWCAAMGHVRRDTLTPDEEGWVRPVEWPVPIADPEGHGPVIWVVPVADPTPGKNRMHHDVVGDTASLVAAGATLLRARDAGADDDPADGGITWDVLADPEGNEFCVFAPDPA